MLIECGQTPELRLEYLVGLHQASCRFVGEFESSVMNDSFEFVPFVEHAPAKLSPTFEGAAILGRVRFEQSAEFFDLLDPGDHGFIGIISRHRSSAPR